MAFKSRTAVPSVAPSFGAAAVLNLQMPSLLIAMPGMDDGFFGKSVILLVEHGEEGTGGLVLNRVAPLELDVLLQAADLRPAPDGPHPVWIGGPVSPQSGVVLYRDEGRPRYDHDVEVLPGIRLSASMSILRDVSAGRGPRQFGLYLGRAGWGPGQLEQELASGTWLTAEPDTDLLFGIDGEQMWHRALAKLQIDETQVVREVAQA
jgi:putative transcriptional regulator